MCLHVMVGCLCVCCLLVKADCRTEADAFLRGLPAGLQARQADAVRQARLGDCEALRLVRQARNGKAAVPTGVMEEDLPGGHRLYRPQGNFRHPLPLLVYFHGGGWTFGSVNSCSRFCSELCARAQVLVLAVEYRLAPEHPYPQGLEDCLQAVTMAQRKVAAWGGEPHLISLGGDSSGGNLALAAAMRLKEGPALRSLVLFYPVVKAWQDLSKAWKRYENGYGLDGRLMEEFNQAYCGAQNPRLPHISPACADDATLKRLPAVLLIQAERDILFSQGSEFAQRLMTLGVRIKRQVVAGAVHLFITVPGQEQAFQRAVAAAGDYLRVR